MSRFVAPRVALALASRRVRTRHTMTTTITVLFFARARELAETSSASVDLDAAVPPTVAAARARLLELYPQLESVLLTAVFALNQSYVDRAREDDTAVTRGDELAVVPPISGG